MPVFLLFFIKRIIIIFKIFKEKEWPYGNI